MDGPIPFMSRDDARAARDGDTPTGKAAAVRLRKPTPEDGAAVNELIARCAPLDENSMYCNLLQCSHFSETCVLAERDGAVVGFVSGYQVPESPEAFFVWQVAVDESARGMKLGKRMILDILGRPGLEEVSELHTTITRDNKPSQGLFSAIARELGADVDREVMFCKERHFDGEGKSEILWRIGPFDRAALAADAETNIDDAA